MAARPEEAARIDSLRTAAEVGWKDIAGSRATSPGGLVRHPRHLLLYRFDGETMLVARVLRRSMDLARHVDRRFENES